MGANLFSENEPRFSCVLGCVHLKNGRNGVSSPAGIPLWMLLSLNILFCLVAALIYSLKLPSSSFYGRALVSQAVAVRQYVQEKLVTHLHTSGRAVLPAGLSCYELFSCWKADSSSELTQASSPKSLATKICWWKRFKKKWPRWQMLNSHRIVLYIFIAHIYHYFVRMQRITCASWPAGAIL